MKDRLLTITVKEDLYKYITESLQSDIIKPERDSTLMNIIKHHLCLEPDDWELEPIRADLTNIYSRINLSIMGDQFNEWAEGYFLPDGPNLDVMIRKADVFNDFVATTGLKLWSSSKFSRALQSFVRNNSHYIECINPPELCPASTPGRIVRKVANRTEYYIYMKTVGNPVQERIKDDFDTPVPPI